VRAYIRNASHRGLREDELAALAAPWITAEGQPAFYRQIEQTDERHLAELEGRLGDIEIPVRIVWGRDDTWLARDIASRLRDRIPGSTSVLVDGAGHLLHYDAPVALAGEIHRWLASQGAARST